ncbi:hypothetical protein KRR55_09195 [Paeniglutamicibacter sp. ABSL32-1]|uniref:hypothetical protein n=1 Tax=Paeniglutamicibacter quisquiliarum TaxID=2849498 RepID=UPI001C2D432C|nr:hypothetical protein [Paeniglutamicibacter quisquiliarum]MBV1779288.1 hypothetical protein [Paeniglutamicibacter quisquiliarum]
MNTIQGLSQGQETLRYLRLMLLVVPLLLVVAILVYGLTTGRVEDSISSYYLGPARDLFVAMLVTIGVLLVVYKGPPLENYALNLAGFYAVFVALVPTRLDETLAGLAPADREALVRSIQVAVIAVVVVAAVFMWLDWKTMTWAPAILLQSGWTRALTMASSVLLAGFLALLAWRTWEGKEFVGVHLAATLLLIGSMAIAIASHLGSDRLGSTDTSGGRGRHYGGLLVLMVLGVVAWPVLSAVGIRQAAFLVEWYEIALFAYFWYLESRRMWTPDAE